MEEVSNLWCCRYRYCKRFSIFISHHRINQTVSLRDSDSSPYTSSHISPLGATPDQLKSQVPCPDQIFLLGRGGVLQTNSKMASPDQILNGGGVLQTNSNPGAMSRPNFYFRGEGEGYSRPTQIQSAKSWPYCWLVRVSLFIELGCPRDLGKGWRGDLGTFIISRLT